MLKTICAFSLSSCLVTQVLFSASVVVNESFLIDEGRLFPGFPPPTENSGYIVRLAPFSEGPVPISAGDSVDFIFRFRSNKALELKLGSTDLDVSASMAWTGGADTVVYSNYTFSILGPNDSIIASDFLAQDATASASYGGDIGLTAVLLGGRNLTIDSDSMDSGLVYGFRLQMDVAETPQSPVYFDSFNFDVRLGVFGDGTLEIVPEPSIWVFMFLSGGVFLQRFRYV